ncbi:MAG: peptidoglycan-binding protein [Candidatus Sericytochromatia bacterium]
MMQLHSMSRPALRPARPVSPAARVAAVPAPVAPKARAAAIVPMAKKDEGPFEKIGQWLDNLLQGPEPTKPEPKPEPVKPETPTSEPAKPEPKPPSAPAVPPTPAPEPPRADDMPILQRGDQGELVLFVQKRLEAAGFPLGATPNGVFGPATEAAVRKFQVAKGIRNTGNVGPLTWAALGVFKNPITPKQAPQIQVAEVAALLGAPAESFKRNWPFLARALAEAGLTDRASVIAALATIHVETSSFEPIHEYGGPSYWARYNGRADLGNRPGTDDGVVYHGRGYIQLTGRANYQTYGEALDLDLVGNPDLALRPDVAARVLVTYFKSRGIPAKARAGDWLGVRRAVNGGTNGYERFSAAVEKLRAHPELFKA